MADSLAGFLRKMVQAQVAIDGTVRGGVAEAALVTTRTIRGQPGYTEFLRGVGRRGARIGVRYDLRGGVNPTALVRATGPFHLLERPTKPRGNHPGTPGKRVFERGVNVAIPLVEGAFKAGVRSSLARVF